MGEKASHLISFPRHGMTATALIYAPIFRPLVVDLCGCASAARKSSFIYYLKNKISFGIIPGGFYEVNLYEQGLDIIYVKKKKGFIKYALKYGYVLFPAYTFGECNTYASYQKFFSESFRCLLSKYQIPTSWFFCGQYFWCPFLPISKGVGLHTVVGQAIECPKVENPSQEIIDKYHKIYMEEIIGIFERNKWRFGMQNKELKVV